MRQSERKGFYTCNCRAYRFPHRFGSGKCVGINVVEDAWAMNWGLGDCKDCECIEEWDDALSCVVESGSESVEQCPIWQEFVYNNEIKIYKGNNGD